MENKNSTIIIALLTLVVGLLFGYLMGTRATFGFLLMDNMHEDAGSYHMHDGVGDHMYEDEIVARDGAMMHAMDEMMLGFRGKSGEEYEEAFLRGMIVHHLGAVEMAEGLLEETDRPELVELAENIIETQSVEIDLMKSWLQDWFNSN